MSNQKTDRTELTFSQAEGIDPLPQPAALGELPQNARASLWYITYESVQKSTDILGDLGDPWATILQHYHALHLYEPADKFTAKRLLPPLLLSPAVHLLGGASAVRPVAVFQYRWGRGIGGGTGTDRRWGVTRI